MDNYLFEKLCKMSQRPARYVFFACILYLFAHWIFGVHLYELIFYIFISFAISLFFINRIYNYSFKENNHILTNYIPFCASILFFVLSLILVLKHEAWLDEAQAYLLVRESKNLLDLFYNTRNEGHPLLWHILIYPFVHMFDSIESIQIVHIAISSVSIYILFKYSPFSAEIKCLLFFNFYILYEYNIISRNYSLSVLLLFIMNSMYYVRYKYNKCYGLLLLLLANTNAIGFIITIAIASVEFFECLTEKTNKKNVYVILVFAMFGILLCLFQILRVDVQGKIPTVELFDDFKLRKAILFSFFPFPNASFSFWGTNFINDTRNFYFLSIFFYVFITIIFILRVSIEKAIFYRFLAIFLGLYAFFTHVYVCSPRHHGFLLLSFVSIEWLLQNNKGIKNIKSNAYDLINNIFKYAFTFILFLQSVYGISACFMDYTYEFSCTKSVGNYLSHSGYSSLQLSSYPDMLAIGVMAYSGIKKCYDPQSKTINKFIQWGKDRNKCKNLMEAYKDVKDRAHMLKEKIIFLTNVQLPEFCEDKLLFVSKKQLCPDETHGRQIYVYLIE